MNRYVRSAQVEREQVIRSGDSVKYILGTIKKKVKVKVKVAKREPTWRERPE